MSATWDASARERVRALLRGAPREMTWEADGYEIEVEFVDPDELEAGQLGYAHAPDGRSLIEPDGWRAEWLVVALDQLLGDPIFVDTSDGSLPVATAAHGEGVWDPLPLARSLEDFIRMGR